MGSLSFYRTKGRAKHEARKVKLRGFSSKVVRVKFRGKPAYYILAKKKK